MTTVAVLPSDLSGRRPLRAGVMAYAGTDPAGGRLVLLVSMTTGTPSRESTPRGRTSIPHDLPTSVDHRGSRLEPAPTALSTAPEN